MAKPPPKIVSDTTPGELAQSPPRDMQPTSDIRFVMIELAKLSAQVERLISDVKDLSGKVDPGQTTRLVDDVKGMKDKIDEVQHTVSFVKGAMWVIAGLFGLVVALGGLYLNSKRLAAGAPVAAVATVTQPVVPPAATPGS